MDRESQGRSAPEIACGDWEAVDAHWEQMQERALELYLKGEGAMASRQWRHALEHARTHFSDDDPRLAASLTNVGFALRRMGRVQAARAHFADAIEVWARTWSWILYMRPDGDEGLFSRAARDEFEAMVARARAVTEGLMDGGEPPELDGAASFLRDRPDHGNDVRRLMAAVLLLVCRPPPSDRDTGA